MKLACTSVHIGQPLSRCVCIAAWRSPSTMPRTLSAHSSIEKCSPVVIVTFSKGTDEPRRYRRRQKNYLRKLIGADQDEWCQVIRLRVLLPDVGHGVLNGLRGVVAGRQGTVEGRHEIRGASVVHVPQRDEDGSGAARQKPPD